MRELKSYRTGLRGVQGSLGDNPTQPPRKIFCQNYRESNSQNQSMSKLIDVKTPIFILNKYVQIDYFYMKMHAWLQHFLLIFISL